MATSNKPSRITPIGSAQLLVRLLEEPGLTALVQGLKPRALGRLIEHIGLEDCGEIVALATLEQMQQVFDDDLWKSAQPGQDETFDAGRFGLWLEVMHEAGDEFLAERLCELPEDLVTLALCRHVLVIDLDALALELSGQGQGDDLIEKALDNSLGLEVAEHGIVARCQEGFDAIVAALLTLDEHHHDFLHRLLARCAAISNEHIQENGGLYQVLTAEEMLETDVAADREERRAREGFIAPAAARSFLALARETPLEDILRAGSDDPITRSYFREFHPAPPGPAPKAGRQARGPLADLLRSLDLPQPTAPRLPPGPECPSNLFARAVALLQQREQASQADRMLQLNFLANVLLAGCGTCGRSLRAGEAAEAVLATCNLGLEYLLQQRPDPRSAPEPVERAAEVLARQGLIRAFRLGWHLLSREVAGPAARWLDRALGKRQRRRPAIESLDTVADEPTREALRAMLDEIPHLTATVGGSERFCATAQDLRAVRDFLDGL